ncbi:PTS sugar transporter subunit IIA [Bradyrhizobium sp. SYSU BS000235]|uniref:PTS sugar transporter subunit IIA n=1 Tax=Bradyrhizobium sp. SYSU BS000235 TaxID=3411332 RepID=UPI003C756E97
MTISDFLAPRDVVCDVRATNKQQLLQELSKKAASSLGLQPEYVAAELLKREGLGSTGMGRGVAIPHARLPMVKKPHGVMARLKPAIDFEAIDGQLVDLVFLLLLPAPPEADQLVALASVARKFKTDELLKQLRQARHESELYASMIE